MSSRFPDRRGAVVAVLWAAVSALAACEREPRLPPALAAGEQPLAPRAGVDVAGAGKGDPAQLASVRPNPPNALGNAYVMSEGKRLFAAFNCVGCHGHGGGAIGPALMDARWYYGSEPQELYATIVGGRPNGMPAFRGKLVDAQVWQLVAYVRSLAGMAPKDAAPGRNDEMSFIPPESRLTPETPRTIPPPPIPRLVTELRP